MRNFARDGEPVNPPYNSLETALAHNRRYPTDKMFPLSGDKGRPCIKDNLALASSDSAQLKRWSLQFPGCWWGIASKQSGLIIIDVDIKLGKVGRESIAALAAQGFKLTPTHKAASQSGTGRHLFYKDPTGGFRFSCKGQIGKDVDVPNYVVLAGCGKYKDLPESGERTDCPQWVLDRIKRPAPTQRGPVGDPIPLGLYTRMLAATSYVGGPDGLDDRHEYEGWLAFAMAAHEAAAGDEGEYLTAFIDWCLADPNAKDTWTPENIERRWQSFTADPAEGEAAVSRGSWFAVLKHLGRTDLVAEAVGGDAQSDFADDPYVDADLGFKPEPERKRIVATPFDPARARATKPRDWLSGFHLCRGYVSGTVAPGGGSKTSHVLVEAVAMALGLDLLNTGAVYHRPLNVWYWNGEDGQAETDRRLAAICRYYGSEFYKPLTDAQKLQWTGPIPTGPLFNFTIDDLKGRLWTDSGRDTPIRLATMKGGEATAVRVVYDELIYECKDKHLDVLEIDPFISSHSLPENANEAIDVLMKEDGWGGIVEAAQIGVEHVHHSRKQYGSAHDITSADARGASAQAYGWRDGRVLNFMTEKEGAATKIDAKDRWRYFKVESDTPRMSARVEAQWRKLVSVDMENATEQLASDNIGVVTPWVGAVKNDFDEADERETLQTAILAMIDDPEEKITKRSGGTYTHKELAEKLKSTKETVISILDSLRDSKVIGYNTNTAGGHGQAGYYRK